MGVVVIVPLVGISACSSMRCSPCSTMAGFTSMASPRLSMAGEWARALAAAGAAVTLAGRRADRLERLAAELGGEKVAVQPTDMRREADILRLFAVARERFGGVDILVNNAGLGRAAPLGSAPTELWREMLEVNVLGLAIATREAIQDMERRGAAGHVVHVASMAAHRVPGPESGMYAA